MYHQILLNHHHLQDHLKEPLAVQEGQGGVVVVIARLIHEDMIDRVTMRYPLADQDRPAGSRRKPRDLAAEDAIVEAEAEVPTTGDIHDMMITTTIHTIESITGVDDLKEAMTTTE